MVVAVTGCQTDTAREEEQPLARVGVEEFSGLIGRDDAVLLDVRTPGEFTEGHIPGAINLDIHSPSFLEEIRQLDRNQRYLVYCRSGRRSLRACELMADQGFQDVVELQPGILGWRGTGKPVSPPATP
jgi:rhodanese-related sulfurtransferase